MSNLATDNVDLAVAYPNVGAQASPVVLRRAIVKHRRYASSPQHQMCGETLLKAQSAPGHSRCTGHDCPPNTAHFIRACLA